VRIRNTGDSDLPVNMFGFQLEDETGVKRNVALAGVPDMLDTATLRPGGVIEGNLAFAAKPRSSVLNLHYAGGMFNDSVVIDLTHQRKQGQG
ncbi:MAG: DUF4352 domain-containing protein, partial [Armatimonadetes bacterium]|nr:DUF4352 domain-containing protein [Armatimonadota bacterium]